MKILITGATGLLGLRLTRALLEAGHSVIAAGRSPPPAGRAGQTGSLYFLEMDFAETPDRSWWESRLEGVDAVINAAGIFRERGGQTFAAVHTHGPEALFQASSVAGVRLVVQVSALGSDAEATTAFHQSKFNADQTLRKLEVDSAVVQPSLIYSPSSGSTQLFYRLAVLPFLMLPRGGHVQPLHVDDVVAGIVRLIEAAPRGSVTVPFVGPRPLSLRAYLEVLRRGLGVRRAAVHVPLSDAAFRRLGIALEKLPGSLVNRESTEMLLRGNVAHPGPLSQLLGRAALQPENFVSPEYASALHDRATLGWVIPLTTFTVAIVWIWTGIVSLGLFPVEQSLRLLSEFGLEGRVAWLALYTAGSLDLALGILTLAAHGRLRRWTLVAQLVLIGSYTLMLTATMPHWWLHPFGPLSKNLPMLAAILLLLAREQRDA